MKIFTITNSIFLTVVIAALILIIIIIVDDSVTHDEKPNPDEKYCNVESCEEKRHVMCHFPVRCMIKSRISRQNVYIF